VTGRVNSHFCERGGRALGPCQRMSGADGLINYCLLNGTTERVPGPPASHGNPLCAVPPHIAIDERESGPKEISSAGDTSDRVPPNLEMAC